MVLERYGLVKRVSKKGRGSDKASFSSKTSGSVINPSAKEEKLQIVKFNYLEMFVLN